MLRRLDATVERAKSTGWALSELPARGARRNQIATIRAQLGEAGSGITVHTANRLLDAGRGSVRGQYWKPATARRSTALIQQPRFADTLSVMADTHGSGTISWSTVQK